MTKASSVKITLLSALVLMATSVSSAATSAEPGVDPAAVNMLKNLTEFTGKLHSFTASTQVTLEDLLANGQRVDIDVSADVVVRRPNKLRAERLGEGISQTFYYDGETLTLYDPVKRAYASQAAPDTIEGVLDYAREDLGLIIPVSDLVYRNAFDILMQNVVSAAVVGESFIGGHSCTHLAFRRPDVDFQVWVATGDVPYPCKYVVTDTSTEQLISTVTVLRNWTFDDPVDDAVFRFTPPEGVQEVPFLPAETISDN